MTPYAQPAPPARRRKLWPLVLLAAVIAAGVGLLGGVVIANLIDTSDKPITATGSMRLVGYPSAAHDEAGNCWGYGGYKDIAEGVQVVITDSTGKTVGLGRLGGGKQLASDAKVCELAWSVPNVPAGDYYGVEVSHRGRLQYTRAQLVGGITMTLG